MKDRLGRPIREYRLVDKDGGIEYKEGTLYDVADYALRNNLTIEKEED